MSNLFNTHPFFDSYSKQTNVISKNSTQDNFFEIFSNLNIIDKEKLLKGESPEIITELESYSGNISTSQLKNIDYSKFSNHVFFDSAVHKVKYSFDEIVKYPYDANESEYLSYITNIDGYTKYILENEYPTYIGHIDFKGETKIIIPDRKGYFLNDFKENEIADGSLSIVNTEDIKNKIGFTFSFHINTPDAQSFIDNPAQTIFKKTIIDDNQKILEGYFCYITDNENEENSCLLNFGIKNNLKDKSYIKSISLKKEEKFYINIIILKNEKNNFDINFCVDSIIVKSEVILNTEELPYQKFSQDFLDKDVSLIIGSGENNRIELSNDSSITMRNFSSSLDEFIIFNKIRSLQEIRQYKNYNIFRNNSVLLYLKFNEKGGLHQNSSLIIDSSGNKLHGILKTTADGVIQDTTAYKISDIVNPKFLLLEELNKNPIILGSVVSVQEKRNSIIDLATKYDASNSNIIFNLMPTHYFTNAANFEKKTAFINPDFDDRNSWQKIGIQGTVNNNHMTQICLIWARFFDQLKLYVDAISGMFDLDYESVNREDFVNSQMNLLCKIYGFDFIEINKNMSREKHERKNILFDDKIENIGLIKLQNLIWKKILINSQDIIRSKGTINSINSFINLIGFDVKKFGYIEEKSYHNYINLKDSYENSFQEIKSLNFSKFRNKNVINRPIVSIDNIRHTKYSDSTKTTIIEYGFNNDYTVELYFDLNKKIYKNHIEKNEIPFKDKQTIMQIINENNICWCIVYAKFKNNKSKNFDLFVEFSPYNLNVLQSKRRAKKIKLENINAYDFSHYVALSFSNKKNNKLRISHQAIGDVADTNNINYKELDLPILNNTTLYSSLSNNSIKIGNVDYKTNAIEQIFNNSILNDTSFEGNLYNIKIWKKQLSLKEMSRHSQDILSIAEDAFVINNSSLVSSFYFNNIEYTLQQENDLDIFSSNFNSIFIDKEYNSENNEYNDLNKCNIKLNFADENSIDDFLTITKLPRKTKSGSIDKIDSNNLNRVRILSYKNEENKKSYDNKELYPIHDMPIDYENYNTDFINFSISSAKSINDAIERLLTEIENITDIISANMQIYEYSYIDIDNLRHSMFENFKDNEFVDYDNLNNIFKYFDNIMNSIIFSLIPNGITFNGFNLVYESHILERFKYQHKNKDSNIPIQDSSNFSQTKFDPCKFISKRSSIYNNNRILTEQGE